jgi:hypothetical protein
MTKLGVLLADELPTALLLPIVEDLGVHRVTLRLQVSSQELPPVLFILDDWSKVCLELIFERQQILDGVLLIFVHNLENALLLDLSARLLGLFAHHPSVRLPRGMLSLLLPRGGGTEGKVKVSMCIRSC